MNKADNPVPALTHEVTNFRTQHGAGDPMSEHEPRELLPGPEGPSGNYISFHCKDPACRTTWGSRSLGTAAGEGRLKSAFTAPLRDRLHFYGQDWTITALLSKASLTTVWVPAAHQRAMRHTQGQVPCSGGAAGADPPPNQEPQLGSLESGAHEVLGTKTWCGAQVSMPPRPREGIHTI